MMNKQSLKRLQFRKWGKRIGTSTMASGNASEERVIVAFAFSCCGKPRVLLKKFAWRLKSHLRWSRKSDSNNIQCSYDLRSYHLNFDDGWSRRRSPLFGLYFGEIEKQLKLDLSTTRCCSSSKDLNEYKDCELAERVWCLYVFHIYRSHQTN